MSCFMWNIGSRLATIDKLNFDLALTDRRSSLDMMRCCGHWRQPRVEIWSPHLIRFFCTSYLVKFVIRLYTHIYLHVVSANLLRWIKDYYIFWFSFSRIFFILFLLLSFYHSIWWTKDFQLGVAINDTSINSLSALFNGSHFGIGLRLDILVSFTSLASGSKAGYCLQ